MKRFTDAGRACVATGNLYAALSLALIVPDICGSLEEPGPGKSKKRYEDWCRQWLEPKFTTVSPRGETKFLTAENCYQIRCSLLHSGSAEIDAGKVTDVARFEFFDSTAGSHLNWIGKIVVDDVDFGGFLQLKADLFSLAMFEAGDEWDASSAGNETVRAEKARLLSIHSKDTTLYGGVISFG